MEVRGSTQIFKIEKKRRFFCNVGGKEKKKRGKGGWEGKEKRRKWEDLVIFP